MSTQSLNPPPSVSFFTGADIARPPRGRSPAPRRRTLRRERPSRDIGGAQPPLHSGRGFGLVHQPRAATRVAPTSRANWHLSKRSSMCEKAGARSTSAGQPSITVTAGAASAASQLVSTSIGPVNGYNIGMCPKRNNCRRSLEAQTSGSWLTHGAAHTSHFCLDTGRIASRGAPR